MPRKFNTVVLALRSGGDFSIKDVELIVDHLHFYYRGFLPLRIICMWDHVRDTISLREYTIYSTPYKSWKGWWTKMNLFSPEMKQFRPFLYLDLDTAVVGDVSYLFSLVDKDFVALNDFLNLSKMASGVMWIPEESSVLDNLWRGWIKDAENYIKRFRGDQDFLRTFISSKIVLWQSVTNKICSFKIHERKKEWLQKIPFGCILICFHGHPRIFQANSVKWVEEYIKREDQVRSKVTIVIPYKEDRGWLREAVNSVPGWVQLLVSQGEGSWPQNFNKALPFVTGDYVKFLHEDDMLTENSIEDSVRAIEEQGVDFIHGSSYSLFMDGSPMTVYQPPEQITFEDLLICNPLHGGTLMFKKEIFDKLGGFDETLSHAEEYDFVLRCWRAGFKLGYCNSILYFYRKHDKQKSKDVEEVLKVSSEVSKRHADC